MREILKESLKKMILNYLGFRFSRSREPLSSFKVGIIIYKETIITEDEPRKFLTKWKEVI